ncbi:LacI family DNA-binding transcriptional regulator [Paraoerskovia marina]|nr:LacI family DNA-binding transcriptional regulator [Paraoerskovia marina]
MMSSTPTLDEVARTAGVSRSTASRAINGGSRVSPEAQQAVDDAVARLGYSPNRAARSLVTRRTDSIALVVPEPDERILNDPFLSGTLRGVNAALGASDLQLVLVMARPGDSSGRIARYLQSGHVDGAIVTSHHREDGLESALLDTRIPSVFVGRPFDDSDTLRYVDMDNVEGGRTAAQHLIDRGRTRIATVTGPLDMTAGVDRFTGWRSALEGAGLDAGRVEHADFTREGGAAAMRRLLDVAPDLDAVFVASDLMASGALRALREAGRDVPGDVAVVGYDDLGIAANAATPLTTIRNPVIELANLATHTVLALVADDTPPAQTSFPVELVVRESS